MKRNILKNVQLDKREKVYRDFRRLKAKGYACQIVLTTKRLVIYRKGKFKYRGRKSKIKEMKEIDINSIQRLEYSIVSTKHRLWAKLIGLIFFLGGLAAGYYFYYGYIPIPSVVPEIILPYAKYVAAGLVAFIGLCIMFGATRTLKFVIETSKNNKDTELEFDVNKYNEVAIRYIASKIRPN